MSLREAASGKVLSPSKIEAGDHVRFSRHTLDPRTFDKICRTIDDAIESEVNKKSPKLVWLNTGSLVGARATVPHGAHEHLWEAAYKMFPGDSDPVAVKARRITVGSLIKWRIALRPERWLVHYRETDKTDIVSGELIHASEYWIEPHGATFPDPPSKRSSMKATIDDLLKKFGKSR